MPSPELGVRQQRCEFITLLGGAAVAWPLPARAQQADPMRVVGVLMSTSERFNLSGPPVGVPQCLAGTGRTDGRNVRFDVRWSGGDIDRVRTFANELVKLAPDVILANGTPVITMSANDSTATLQSGNGCAACRPYAALVKAEIASRML